MLSINQESHTQVWRNAPKIEQACIQYTYRCTMVYVYANMNAYMGMFRPELVRCDAKGPSCHSAATPCAGKPWQAHRFTSNTCELWLCWSLLISAGEASSPRNWSWESVLHWCGSQAFLILHDLHACRMCITCSVNCFAKESCGWNFLPAFGEGAWEEGPQSILFPWVHGYLMLYP